MCMMKCIIWRYEEGAGEMSFRIQLRPMELTLEF